MEARTTVGVARDLLDLATHLRANQFLPTPAGITYDIDDGLPIEVTLEPEHVSWWLASLDVDPGEPELQELTNEAVAVIHHCRLPLRRPDGVRVDIVFYRIPKPSALAPKV